MWCTMVTYTVDWCEYNGHCMYSCCFIWDELFNRGMHILYTWPAISLSVSYVFSWFIIVCVFLLREGVVLYYAFVCFVAALLNLA